MSVLAELKEIKRRFFSEEDKEDKENEENVDKDGDRKDPRPTLNKDKKEKEDQDSKKKTKKVSQDEANYIDMSSDPDKRCSSCVQFITPESCHKVEGDVDSDGLCRFFEKKGSEKEEK